VARGVRTAVEDFARLGLLEGIAGSPPGHDPQPASLDWSTPRYLDEPPEG
jgi:hypothetical protein